MQLRERLRLVYLEMDDALKECYSGSLTDDTARIPVETLNNWRNTMTEMFPEFKAKGMTRNA